MVWSGLKGFVAAASCTIAIVLTCLCMRVGAQVAPQNSVTGGSSQPQSQPAAPGRRYTALNAQLLQYCRDKVGQKVGSGEGADLVEEGLTTVHALARAADYPNSGDYVWGLFVCSLAARNGMHRTQVGQAGNGKVEPGDVI